MKYINKRLIKTFLSLLCISFLCQVRLYGIDIASNSILPQVKKINDKLSIHSIVSSAESNYVVSHIIETENNLILVDNQFYFSYASSFRKYIDALQKPVIFALSTHGHPDNIFGLSSAAFADITYVTSDIIREYARVMTRKYYERDDITKYILTGQIPNSRKKIRLPQSDDKILGSHYYDNLHIIIERIANQEVNNQLIIKIPDARILVAQDLLMNNTHMLIVYRLELEKSIAQLQELRRSGYLYVMTGHGLQTDYRLFNQNIAYLRFVQSLLAQQDMTAKIYTSLLRERYPDYNTYFLEKSAELLF